MTARAVRVALVMALAVALTACVGWGSAPRPPVEPPLTKGLDGVVDSTYLPLERSAIIPGGYALYTVVLTRSANPVSVKAVGRLLATTVAVRDAALDRRNLNLIMLPVRDAAEATRRLAQARAQPDATAAALLQQHYDYGQANLLLGTLCRTDRGVPMKDLCGNGLPEGPVLVAGQTPLQPTSGADQRLLVMNLSNMKPEAVGEALAAFRRQILRKDFDSPDSVEYWRLWVLDKALAAAKLLPGIGVAQAGTLK